MDNKKEINAIYKILALYEDIDNIETPITLESYLNYVDRLYIKWLGIGNNEIYETLKGLWVLGKEAGHRRVKSMVFHMINIINEKL